MLLEAYADVRRLMARALGRQQRDARRRRRRRMRILWRTRRLFKLSSVAVWLLWVHRVLMVPAGESSGGPILGLVGVHASSQTPDEPSVTLLLVAPV